MIYTFLIFAIGLIFLAICVKNFNSPIEKKKDSLVALVKGFSYDNPSAVDDIKLYVSNRTEYFKKYEDELLQRGIESENEITDSVALVDALIKAEKIAYMDWKLAASEALKEIDKLSGGKLAEKGCYNDLVKKFEGTSAAASAVFDDKDESNIYDCTKAVRYQLLIIDENSDSYACVLVDTQHIYSALSTAKDAGIKIRYEGEIVT